MAAIAVQLYNAVVQVLTGAQTELVILVFAICAHVLFFGKYQIGAPPAVSKQQQSQEQGKRTGNPPNSAPKPDGAQKEGAGAALAQSVLPLLRKGATQDVLAKVLLDALARHRSETVPAALVKCLEIVGDELSCELLKATRRVLHRCKVEPKERLGELLLQGCLSLSLLDDFDEVLAQIQTADGCIPFGLAIIALKASISTSQLKPALGCLKSLGNGPALSSEQRSCLQQLVRLAANKSSLPVLVKELRKYGLVKTACLYNTLLDACIECQHFAAVEEVMLEAKAAGMADVVTYNTILKARLRDGNIQKAYQILETMREVGLQPNCVTFNELLDATISIDTEKAWSLVTEMRSSGLKPNHITCSILLKSVQPNSRSVDADRALAVVNSMEDDMDEVLLSSVLEACIRVSRADLLVQQLKKYRLRKRVPVKGAQTFGSIIRAYGCVRDLSGVQETWNDMRSRGISPTSITLGCTVEALASNGDPEAAHALTHEMLADEHTRPLVNAVIYCSVLKGFSHQKRFDRVWTVYEEMIAGRFQGQFTSVTYNTLMDACARCGEISRAPKLLEDMVRQGIEPNLVTYSAVLKGYCQENRLDKAFELLDTMRMSSHVKPDELTYNTLLDGCARQGCYERGMQVFAQMQEASVKPSNFTLSVLVKLANRGRRLEEAFDLCARLPVKYRFRLNVHVYNNLMQACIAHKDLERAFEVLEQMLSGEVRPDIRSYTLLLRGCISLGLASDAAGLLRAAVGLDDIHPRLLPFEARAFRPRENFPVDLVAEFIEGIARQCHDEVLAIQLLSDARRVGWLKLDPKLSMRLATKAIQNPGPW